MEERKLQKSELARREEEILKFWREKEIFAKTLEKEAPEGEFVFYEGPPTANGRPGIHHLEARAFKDAIPRYKTMRGYHVRRKGGWDTHGLPVELQVEKELGLKSKKEVEKYGVAKFNRQCKESVWKYVREWEEFTNRVGYWVDLDDPYITYQTEYIESLWHILKQVDERGLLYKDYKVVPWCPRCETGLSSHELAQGYADVKDLAVTVKFRLKNELNTYLLAWTTTPWTLPGNVALAVGNDIDYVRIKLGGESLILAEARLSIIKDAYAVEKKFKGAELVGLEYEPLYPFAPRNENSHKVYPANFVTDKDGTGIVHTAVMYGPDDFELGTQVGLPKVHLVNEDGTFKTEAEFLAGKFVKSEETDVAIIKDLASRGLLLAKEKHEHSYPFCWRCKTPLIYFARDSWYIRMSDLREELVRENQDINWEPKGIKDGRFGEWLKEVKDWAISRERYWGTPLPIWVCEECGEREVVGSLRELLDKREPRNRYFVMRHGEAQHNVQNIVSDDSRKQYSLTDNGRKEVLVAARRLKTEEIDLIIASPVLRTRKTAELVADVLGLPKEKIIFDDRLREVGLGEFNDQTLASYHAYFGDLAERFERATPGGENLSQVKLRALQTLYEFDAKQVGKKILLVTHESVAWLLQAGIEGVADRKAAELRESRVYAFATGEFKSLVFSPLPHDSNFELDVHRPYIDEIKLVCPKESCGGQMRRVKEVMDVWFDSGAMPFAQDHYPFDVEEQELSYPADFISEAIDQTRGWFYTLHALGVLLGKGKAYRNVICLGLLLDAEGKKMSKSVGNVVDPWEMMDKYGADVLRFWMYTVNQPGEAKNFDEKTVDEMVKKVFNLAGNVLSFYKMYGHSAGKTSVSSSHVLDRWILARLDELIEVATTGLDNYSLLEPARAIRDFIGDLSQWYLRRSRDRFKSEDKDDAGAATGTMRYVLEELAKVMAPFAPFFAEYLYREVGGEKESVHLEDWPKARKVDREVLEQMKLVREIVSLVLEARAKAGIKVRQSLKQLVVSNYQLSDELARLIKDEVNVKELVFDQKLASGAVALDTELTPELREEGELRDLIREIQDWRKQEGLKPGQLVVVPIPAAKRALVEKYAEELKGTTSAESFVYQD